MGKRQRHLNKTGDNVYASEHLDDNLLPSAEEIRMLKEVDSKLVPFLMKAANKEQEKRHSENEALITLSKREQGHFYAVKYLALTFAFLLVAGGGCLSYFLISEGHVLEGSLFGGVAIAFVAYYFISVANPKVSPPEKQ